VPGLTAGQAATGEALRPLIRSDRPLDHDGEQAVQRRAGEGAPDWGTPMFTPDIPAGFDSFLRKQRLVAISAPDAAGAIWCSVITGAPGFIDPADSRTIVLHALPAPGDPLREACREPRDIGMVVMSPETQRRVKVSGIARRHGDTLVIRTEQVLGNCPKYLQRRVVQETLGDPGGDGRVSRAAELSAGQQELIRSADTFFIGSLSPRHGADANHRGGMPGFVTVTGPRSLSWPDYVGNSFYMTLGNLALHPRCGLAFPGWDDGGLLQLTGTATINWDADEARQIPGALRTVEFELDQTVQIEHASRLRWQLLHYSRFNPPAARADPRSP
jgi:hypothetical protein